MFRLASAGVTVERLLGQPFSFQFRGRRKRKSLGRPLSCPLPRIAWLLFVTPPLQPSSHHSSVLFRLNRRGSLLRNLRSSRLAGPLADWPPQEFHWLFSGARLPLFVARSLALRNPFPRVAFTRRNGSTQPEPRQRCRSSSGRFLFTPSSVSLPSSTGAGPAWPDLGGEALFHSCRPTVTRPNTWPRPEASDVALNALES